MRGSNGVRVSVLAAVLASATPAPRAQESEASRALTIELVDATDGAPVAGSIRLWRLDLPEDEGFTAGDVDLGLRAAPLGRARVEGLAPGRYRAACGVQRRGSIDPPAFELSAGDARVELRLELPREREVFLVLFDESGALLDEAEVFGAPSRFESKAPYAPAWPEPRRAKDGVESLGLMGGSGGMTCPSCRAWRRVAAEPRGFPLGRSLEDSQERTRSERWRWRGHDRSEVDCCVLGAHLGEPLYAGATIDPQSVLRHVLLPEGGDARALARRPKIECEGVLVEGGDLAAAWRALEVAVEIHAPHFEALSFRYRPAEGEPPDRVLERRAER